MCVCVCVYLQVHSRVRCRQNEHRAVGRHGFASIFALLILIIIHILLLGQGLCVGILIDLREQRENRGQRWKGEGGGERQLERREVGDTKAVVIQACAQTTTLSFSSPSPCRIALLEGYMGMSSAV